MLASSNYAEHSVRIPSQQHHCLFFPFYAQRSATHRCAMGLHEAPHGAHTNVKQQAGDNPTLFVAFSQLATLSPEFQRTVTFKLARLQHRKVRSNVTNKCILCTFCQHGWGHLLYVILSRKARRIVKLEPHHQRSQFHQQVCDFSKTFRDKMTILGNSSSSSCSTRSTRISGDRRLSVLIVAASPTKEKRGPTAACSL